MFRITRCMLERQRRHGKKFIIPNGMTFDQISEHIGDPHTKQEIMRNKAYADISTASETAGQNLIDNFDWQKKREQHLLKRHNGDIYAALEEFVTKSPESATQQLKSRAIDKKIYEEIFQEQHGKRIKHGLRKGLQWEHWIAHGDDSRPITKASDKAQIMFGMGGDVRLMASAKVPEHFPNDVNLGAANNHKERRRAKSVFEIPLIGRTNVGKSSLLNSLLNTHVADYDCTPGTTLACNFYDVAGQMRFVDCPGYGHVSPVRAPTPTIEMAQATMRRYLHQVSEGKRNCPRVLLCISADLGIHAGDKKMVELLEQLRIRFTVVMTKTDEVEIRRLARMIDYTRCQLVHYQHCEELMLTSASSLAGIMKLQNLIGSFGSRKQDSATGYLEDVDFKKIM